MLEKNYKLINFFVNIIYVFNIITLLTATLAVLLSLFGINYRLLFFIDPRGFSLILLILIFAIVEVYSKYQNTFVLRSSTRSKILKVYNPKLLVCISIFFFFILNFIFFKNNVLFN
jgi:hypothetical protein